MLVCLIFLISAGGLAYHRSSLKTWNAFVAAYLLLITLWSTLSFPTLLLIWVLIGSILLILNISSLRQKFLTRLAYKIAAQKLPKISDSEKLAIESGTVSWDAEIFSGMPNWTKLFDYKAPQMSEEEKRFIEGPAETLCQMGDNWDMWHKNLEFRKDMDNFAKENGFMGLRIPKKYGGKGFSVTATWEVLMKVGNESGPLSFSMVIANSIGSAELLLHYGTEEQKKYYLPRLAKGIETSCFALTSPSAGSDANAIEDNGVVCKGMFEGKEVIGIRLNFNKRYITLGPIATLLGLAFRLYDPDHLIGAIEDIGISIALIPTKLPGITQGRRHYPIGMPFPNGPLQGKDVFIPLDNLLGGLKMAGKGWMMLTHSLAGGRATSLPTGAVGTCKYCFYVTSVYTGIRKQFGLPIGKFEGVQEKLAELAGYAYLSDATRRFTFSQLQAGENPAITAAISKYNTTEMARQSAIHAIDLHGGKGVMNGPNNYVASSYLSAPIAVTVEGSNTMTRSFIVFGQGAIRCHPYLLPEMNALQDKNFYEFDTLVMKHMNYTFSNHIRALVLGLSSGWLSYVQSPNKPTKRSQQHLTRFSAAFALISDVALITLGGKLKKMESLSGKFADVFSMLFMGSAVIKHYQDQGCPVIIEPVIKWTLEWATFRAQCHLDSILHNFPNHFLRFWLRLFIFPLGKRFTPPSDALSHKVATLVQSSKEVRELIAEGIYLTPTKNNFITQLEEALAQSENVAELDKQLVKAKQLGTLKKYTYLERIEEAREKVLITKSEEKALLAAHKSVMKILNVDDFSLEQLHLEK